MTTKRLLLISRCPPYPLHLGDRLIIWHLCRELRERAYEIDLIAFAQATSDKQDLHFYRKNFRHVTLIDEAKRSPVMYLQRAILPFKRFPHDAKSAWSSAMWQSIEQHLKANDYAIVHLFGGVQVYEFAHLLHGQKVIITPYESFSLYLQRALSQKDGLLPRLNHLMAQVYERWMYTPYSQIVVLTAEDKAALQGLNPQLPLTVIPNGIELDFFTPSQDSERESATLLFVGNYEYPPNVDAALVLAHEIFPKVQAAIPEAHLQLVGHAPPPELQALASASIEVTGRVADVRPYLESATVFVCPLRIGAGIKNKVLEALAMHLPIVASPLSVDGIAVQHGESVLIAEIPQMAEMTVQLLQDSALQAQLAQNGRHIIEAQYSWSAVADSYETLYGCLAQMQGAVLIAKQ